MTVEEVEKVMSDYLICKARCSFLAAEIEELEHAHSTLERTMVEDSVQLTPNLTGMPRGGGISDPTGKLALLFASGEKSEIVKRIEAEIRADRDELRQKKVTVSFVDTWMTCLSPKEKYVVEGKAINGLFWREVVAGYLSVYGESYSKHGLKKLYDRAMMRILIISK